MDTMSLGTATSPSITVSSHSGSGKNDGSIDKEMDEDFTKDNAASPIDLECHIQAERITKLLDEAIYKTKLSICLPRLVHEFNTIKSVLTPHHMDDLIFIFEQYDEPLFSTSFLNVGAMEDIKGGNVSLKNRLNPELGHLLCIMNSYPQLKNTVDAIIEEMTSNYTSYQTKPPEPCLEYLRLLENFRDLMLRQMNSTAADVLADKIKMRKLEESNAKLMAMIKECKSKIKEENDSFVETMAKKTDIMAKMEQELVIYRREADVKLKKKILDSDRQMVLATRAHNVKYEMLQEEEAETTELYESVLKRNMIDEKNLRARRCKVETQLMSWLQKYDVEMADKQVGLDELTQKYENEVTLVKGLEEKLTELDKEYVPLMEEREKEYQQEMTEKMEKFLIEHAARVIQVSWRTVLANRSEKKKLKKLIKKKEAAALIAEKAAAKAAKAAAKAAPKKENKKG